MELIEIRRVWGEISARMDKGFLEAEGIKCVIQPDDSAFYGKTPDAAGKRWIISVPQESGEKARQLLSKRDTETGTS
jgi:hypothetical protein